MNRRLNRNIDLARRVHDDPRLRVNNRRFLDQWEDDFDKTARRSVKAFVAVWAAILIANLVIWGVIIWAIIELVQWVKTK